MTPFDSEANSRGEYGPRRISVIVIALIIAGVVAYGLYRYFTPIASPPASAPKEQSPFVLDDDAKDASKSQGIIYVFYDSYPVVGEDSEVHRYKQESAAIQVFDAEVKQYYPDLSQIQLYSDDPTEDGAQYGHVLRYHYYRCSCER